MTAAGPARGFWGTPVAEGGPAVRRDRVGDRYSIISSSETEGDAELFSGLEIDHRAEVEVAYFPAPF